MFRDTIKKALQEVTGLETVQVDVPTQEGFGDYSSNVALQLKSVKGKAKNPREIAEEIRGKLIKIIELNKLIEKIEIDGPGFLNFWIKEEVLLEAMPHEGNRKKDGKKIMYEFGQPNTHKLPHIGHLFSYILGSATTNILEAAGNILYRVNYQGDIGPHVAKCLWALQKQSPDIPEDLEEKVQLLQKMYQEGSKAYEEDESAKQEINEVNKKIYEKDPEITKLWEETREWNLTYYKEFEKRLGITFDRYYFESEIFGRGKEIVESNLDHVFKKSEGAIIFEGSTYGLHDRVFITKYGTPTYEAKDMALQQLKMEEWPADLLIITTANEQNEYFKVVFKALETLDPSFNGKLKHIGFGMVSLSTGKMSSRTGQIVSAIDLVNSTIAEVAKFVEGREDLNDKEKQEVAEKVGIGAIKYAFLKSNPLQNIKFDLKESISVEGNSGPYLQYTVARIESVLRKSEIRNPKSENDSKLKIEYGKLEPEELSVLRTLIHFTEVIEDAAGTYSPNLLANYLYDLAQKFNTFYNKHRILEAEDDSKEFRLALTQTTASVLQNGLHLLGIETPEKM